ncbi:MAG: AbrB/MazE/SpoVT family DNA-binding domain-containing protein [Verrucomicrobiales bacterium]|nr:AbrB/MazE/SpoVT family DNA-binding domain-containing protein [Verrucomicrobiales bacterium]
MKSTLLTQKGQVTVPKELRDAFGWKKNTELTFVKESDGVRIVEVQKGPAAIIEKMKKAKWIGPSTDELLSETRSEI